MATTYIQIINFFLYMLVTYTSMWNVHLESFNDVLSNPLGATVRLKTTLCVIFWRFNFKVLDIVS